MAWSPDPTTDRASQNLTPLHVLVVSESEPSRALLKSGLEKEGFYVSAVDRASSAARLTLLERRSFSAVLCEAERSDDEILSFCRLVRGDSQAAEIPTAVLSRNLDKIAGRSTQILRKPLFVRDVAAMVRLLAETEPGAQSFPGNTDSLAIPYLLRALLSTTGSGRLELRDGSARLMFSAGTIVDVRYGETVGEAALSRVLCLANGPYSVSFGSTVAGTSWQIAFERFCAEFLPRYLRWRHLAENSAPLDSRWEIVPKKLAASAAQLPSAVFKFARLFDGRRTLYQCLATTEIAPEVALATLARLNQLGILVRAPSNGPVDENPTDPALRLPDLSSMSPSRLTWILATTLLLAMGAGAIIVKLALVSKAAASRSAAHINSAEKLKKAGDGIAAEIAERWVRERATNPHSVLAAAVERYEAGDSRALADFLRAHFSGPGVPVDVSLMIAWARAQFGDVTGGLEALESARTAALNDARVSLLAAGLYWQAGQPEKAGKELKMYLTELPAGPFASEARQILQE